MDTMTETKHEISSALRCRLSQAEMHEPVDPDGQHRHLLLQELAQNAELDVQAATPRRLFRRAR
jgi:hypothetical protein